MTETNHIAVVPCAVTLEGVTLADGRVVAVELSQPRNKFAIVLESAGEVEVVALLDDEGEAVEAAQRLEAELGQMASAPAGTVLQ